MLYERKWRGSRERLGGLSVHNTILTPSEGEKEGRLAKVASAATQSQMSSRVIQETWSWSAVRGVPCLPGLATYMSLQHLHVPGTTYGKHGLRSTCRHVGFGGKARPAFGHNSATFSDTTSDLLLGPTKRRDTRSSTPWSVQHQLPGMSHVVDPPT